MRMYDLIMKKRNGKALTKEEIDFIIDNYTIGKIPDYQMSAFLMAIYFKGMNEEETLNLTMAMVQSGEMLNLSAIAGKKADKHSTGGVGDKTSLVLAPMIASLGIPVVKMSGRGLGHTGGTIDKLESFSGFSTNLTPEKLIENVNSIQIAMIEQTETLAPADKKLYALRDVTATVDHISLIASSIMSKKLAVGSDVIVLDVKTGSGAFMKKEADAVELAREMVQIGANAGRETVAIISDMNQPLGYAVGNALEVKEAIETLNGNGPSDLIELCLTLGSYMITSVGCAGSVDEARQMLCKTIEDEKALKKLEEFVTAQNGDARAIFDTSLLPRASIIMEILAEEDGFIEKMETDEIGMAVLILGGGREIKESEIDLSVGIILRKKIGDAVKTGESIATMYGNDLKKMEEAKSRFLASYTFSKTPVPKNTFIKWIITKNGTKKY